MFGKIGKIQMFYAPRYKIIEKRKKGSNICDVIYAQPPQKHECKVQIRTFGLMQLRENLLQFLIEVENWILVNSN